MRNFQYEICRKRENIYLAFTFIGWFSSAILNFLFKSQTNCYWWFAFYHMLMTMTMIMSNILFSCLDLRYLKPDPKSKSAIRHALLTTPPRPWRKVPWQFPSCSDRRSTVRAPGALGTLASTCYTTSAKLCSFVNLDIDLSNHAIYNLHAPSLYETFLSSPAKQKTTQKI